MTLFLALTASLLASSAAEESFELAVSDYHAGNYASAAVRLEDLVGEQVADPAVFYNLGNAYFRMGRLGYAIVNYERALQVDPGFENAAINLAEAVSRTQRGLAPPSRADWEQSLLFWHYGLSRRAARKGAIMAWAGFWLVLAVRQFRRVRYSGPAACVLVVLALSFGASAWARTAGPRLAVAVSDTVPVYFGTDGRALRFELYEGDRVLVDDHREGWMRVVARGDEKGWARADELFVVGPPYERTAPRATTPRAGGDGA